MLRLITAVVTTLVIGCVTFAAAETAILQIQVLEGDGAVFGAGSLTQRAFAVRVTDETGRPIEGVAVSFRLPDEEATGLFRNGLRTEIAVTATDGRAAAWGVKWGSVVGSVKVRVTAAKDQARAGTLISAYVSEGGASGAGRERDAPLKARSGSRARWWMIVLAASGGAAAAGLARQGKGATQTPAAAAAPAVQIGNPVIAVGRP